MNYLHTQWLAASSAHSFWIGAAMLWLFSAAVSAMDKPQPGDSHFYGWLYRFTHLLAANLDRVLRLSSLEQQRAKNIPNNKE